MRFSTCPRCGDQGYERLSSHDYCVSCDYSPDFDMTVDLPIPFWAQKAVDDPKDSLFTLINAAAIAAVA
ncbi:hypothetical protein WDW37_07280 [Bdellovibrionota bacterium FG-1]